MTRTLKNSLFMLLIVLSFALAMGAFVGCGNVDDDDDDQADDDDDDDDTQDDDDDDTGDDDDDEAGTPTIVECYIKGMVQQKVRLYDMQVEENLEPYDFMVHHCAAKNPCIFLAGGVGSNNQGAAGYDNVTEAPESVYVEDEGSNLAIGDDFWTERIDEESRFIMSEHVYVLKLVDGTYGKIQVLSAQAGTVMVLAYHQDDGTRNIATDTPADWFE